MHLIVTRPEADAAEMAGRIEAMGHRVSLAPLLDMRPTGARLDFAGVQAIVATSRNALRALADGPLLEAVKRLPIFVVGPASAELARDIGFTTVTAGTGGGRQLLPLIEETCTTGGGPLLYLSGDAVAFDMGAALGDAGYDVRHQVVYEAVEASSLPGDVVSAIRGGEVAGVILMSARTAKVFIRLARKAGAGSEAERLAYLCISQTVADALGEPKLRVLVADRPTSEEMLALVKELASNWL
jgi:uroporphyrinogen-III synthase